MSRRLRSLVVLLSVVATIAVPGLGSAIAAPVSPASAPPAAPGALTGNWRATTGSYTGYRVTTDIVLVGRQTINGRTTAVTGTAAVRLVSGRERLNAARFTADLRKATTGDPTYDRQGALLLETSKYPHGVFVLVTPVYLPSATTLARGTTMSLVGNLTLHGVTRRVTVPARVVASSSKFTVTGTIPVLLSDYEIPLVAAGGLARTDDRATVNFRVIFVR